LDVEGLDEDGAERPDDLVGDGGIAPLAQMAACLAFRAWSSVVAVVGGALDVVVMVSSVRLG